MTTNLTPAAFKYLAGIYEHCIDSKMNVVEIQHYLGRKGINRPLIQVRHELNDVFQFAGYADANPPPPIQSVADYDRSIGG
jgi:hypothetical protein